MTNTEKMLIKQFLLRVRQEGYTLVTQPPRSLDGINIDIYRNKTLICHFDDRQLGGWSLRVHADDSTRADIKQDFSKLFYMFIHLRNAYCLYEDAAPLEGYDQSLGYKAIMENGNCTLAVRGGSMLGELEFSTFLTETRGDKWGGTNKCIRHNKYFDMEDYAAAKLDFVMRSGLLPSEQIITPNNVQTLYGACVTAMKESGLHFNDEVKSALGQTINNLEKMKDSFFDAARRTTEIPATNASYMEAKIFSTKAIFTKHQINRDTLPKGLYAYDIQYSRDKMEPETIWPRVGNRRFGTVVTKKPIAMGERGYTELGQDGLSLNPDRRGTLRMFQQNRSMAQAR